LYDTVLELVQDIPPPAPFITPLPASVLPPDSSAPSNYIIQSSTCNTVENIMSQDDYDGLDSSLPLPNQYNSQRPPPLLRPNNVIQPHQQQPQQHRQPQSQPEQVQSQSLLDSIARSGVPLDADLNDRQAGDFLELATRILNR
jgi:hypothetical protein